jgi:hypothetical protein
MSTGEQDERKAVAGWTFIAGFLIVAICVGEIFGAAWGWLVIGLALVFVAVKEDWDNE